METKTMFVIAAAVAGNCLVLHGMWLLFRWLGRRRNAIIDDAIHELEKTIAPAQCKAH